MAKSASLWFLKVEENGLVRVLRDGKPLKSTSGKEYGFIKKFATEVHKASKKTCIKVGIVCPILQRTSLSNFVGNKFYKA